MIAQAQAETHRDRGRDRPARSTTSIAIAAWRSDQPPRCSESQQADADHKKALAADAKARAALEAAQRQLDVIDTQKRSRRRPRWLVHRRPRRRQLNLGYTEIRAPIDGTVGNRSARTGAYATVGAQLISLVPARGLWVDANFKESQLARMRAGNAGDGSRRRAAGRGLPRPCGEPGAGDRRGVQRASAGERHRATSPRSSSACRCVSLDGDAATLGRLRPGLSVVAVHAVDASASSDLRQLTGRRRDGVRPRSRN